MTTEYLSFQNVQPKAGTPGVAQDAPAGGGSQQQAPPGGGIMMFLPFLIMVPFLFMMFRRQKKEAAERAKLKKGDRVVSTSGLIGEIIEIDERLAKVKIAPGTTVQMLASSISPFGASTEAAPAKKDDVKDAKPVTDKK
ncbi:preprotein translocase subunit YajC [Pendulispora albinea]|uniref:Sec translocon accessory complex subunit YajC n=1 Tax=Pendulispora albinea TaxID=2741071 RepID=A0ABZ2LSU6_9BACT